jgi:hypothetical protein
MWLALVLPPLALPLILGISRFEQAVMGGDRPDARVAR